MTLQDIFNKVAEHLLTQGAHSMATNLLTCAEGTVTCAYRGAEGRMCAVGVLISDEHYSPDLEGLSADSYTVTHAVECSTGKLTPIGVGLLSDLQVIHDNAAPDEWPSKLARVAKTYGLTTEGVL